ncbi:MAG: PDZ domain-containing protein [Anaerolineae bacterium]|nr:PDZ domain-containing protein [Anaerolineae bacterium]
MKTVTNSRLFTVVAGLSLALLSVFALFNGFSVALAAGHVHPAHPYIGVEISKSTSAATVMAVMANSPAAKAGLKKGDVISAIDGKKVSSADIAASVAALQVGNAVKLSITRDGKAMEISVTLGDMPVDTLWINGADETVFVYHAGQDNWEVRKLADSSALYKAGLRADDLIATFNGKPYTAETLATYVLSLKKTDEVTLAVDRMGKKQDIKVTAEALSDISANPTIFYQDELQSSAQLEIQFLPLTDTLAKDYATSVKEGLLIVNASANMQKAGIKLLDVITGVNGKPFTTQYALSDALKSIKNGDKVSLDVNRAGKTMKIDVTVAMTASAASANGTSQLAEMANLLKGFVQHM